MKYFFIRHTIKDGEYEYMFQSPVRARTREGAIRQIEKDDKQWTLYDYRLYEIDEPIEVTKAEYEVLHKYVY